MIKAATVAIALFLLFATVAATFPLSTTLTDTLSHFPLVYLALGAGAALVILLTRLPLSWALPVFVACGFFAMQIYPFLPRAATTATTAGLRIMQANVFYKNPHTRPLRDLIDAEKPDIVILAEVNDAFRAMTADIAGDYPYRFFLRDVAIISKMPLDDITARDRDPLTLVTATPDRKTVIATAHTAAPPRHVYLRDRHIGMIERDIAAHMATLPDAALILSGDLNITPYAVRYRQMTARLGLVNAREGRGILGSYPTFLPALFRVPIDHLLINDKTGVRAHYLLPPIGSDHRPLMTVLDPLAH